MHGWFTGSYDLTGEACKTTFAVSRFDFSFAIMLQVAMRDKKTAAGSTKPIALTIVSDDPDLRDELASILRTAGYGVSTLGSTDVYADEGSQATIYTGEASSRHSARRRLGRRFKGAELLTVREVEVFEKIAQGASNQEAARQLGISRRTVETHRARILEKLGAPNTAALIKIVLGDGK
jgi:DNA-binding CsgD family transcriptional regulator